MDKIPKFELNIALIPDDELAAKLIATSKKLASLYPTVVQLNDVRARLAFAPHLTLYQVPIPMKNLDKTLRLLAEVARTMQASTLKATQYAYNAGEASFEVQYEVTDHLVLWQSKVIEGLNSLRDGLVLERDPAGHVVSELLEKEGVLGKILHQTGYGEAGDPRRGGLFRPHATLNWFELGTKVVESDSRLLSAETLSGKYPALGVYLLGPYGTCPQRIARYSCAVS